MIQEDILDTVSALEPPALRERAEELSRANREQVLARARAAGGRRAFLRAAADRRWRLPVTVGALATAAAVAAGLFVYSPERLVVPGEPGGADVQNSGTEAPAYADARELLAAAAEAAAAQEEEQGGFWYVRTRNHRPAGPLDYGQAEYTALQTFTEEEWVELGGGFRTLNNLNLRTETTFPSEADERAWEEAGSPELDHTTPMSTAYRGEGVNMLNLRVSELPRLPGDAEGLEVLLREQWTAEVERGGEPGQGTEEHFDAYLREAFADLATSPVRGDTRGALFTVAAGLEGIRLVGPAEDPLGRAGYKVAVPYALAPQDEELTTYWIIDPGTGTLLSEHRAGGEVWVAYEEAGFVQEIGEPAVPVDYQDLRGE
ncbi:CU044_5270 family protein [Nocardiopsis changdeensis]|uniref:CU044_5270 family protein n=1 Tax=Nocardiopsis changdeensis TaxID=2831969 RepID=A0ABX8BQ42_9ACTN|nr:MULTISPECIES: CU044_5270 family protein [Nocardiopsis]QUX24350.1 CU044_5270 family protein [Nocardiopsis changdeensis]QYX34741.1 CU044_5270 family protein [Nocardiopsis sp. MT53]